MMITLSNENMWQLSVDSDSKVLYWQVIVFYYVLEIHVQSS